MTKESFKRNLQCELFMANSVQTAAFVSPDNNKPVSLLVHGINGSHFGLVELARHAQETRPILVDLPGHGQSAMPKWHDLANLRRWLDDVYSYIVKNYTVSKIVLHSFGCYAASKSLNRYDLNFLCPVATPAKRYTLMARILGRVLKFNLTARIYNWLPFSIWRGTLLLADKRQANRHKIAYVAKHDACTSTAQRHYQMDLLGIINTLHVFDDIVPHMVIIGHTDKTSADRTLEQVRPYFPKTQLREVAGGHLAPIENAAEISAIIGL